jgi:glycosyltransferase involved in cell wall biosynthesis
MNPVSILSIAQSDGRRPLVFGWGVSSFFGWGVHGINLLLTMAGHPEFAPLCVLPFGPADVILDPLRTERIAAMAQLSAPLWSALETSPGPDIILDHPLLEGLGNGLQSGGLVSGKAVTGNPSIGVVALEQANLNRQARQRAERYALLAAVSSWGASVLRGNGIDTVTTVLLGVDTALYHPAPRTGLFPGRFVIFSGGKLEFRKGQDLVLAAFRAFRQRHPEALLLTAWHSPWSDLAAHAAGHPGITTPRSTAEGVPDVVGWAVDNGIPADAVFSVGSTPNNVMPYVIREADAALFPNRCEGGTNMVAMECLACGIPCILSANTGHLDLLRQDIALRLERQGTVTSQIYDPTEWGESDVEEMVEKLEAIWRDRSMAAAMGARAAAFMATMTWRKHVNTLLRAIEPFID